jgi:hypothetical protein
VIDVLTLAIEADGLSNAGNHLKATAGAGNLALDALRPRGFAADKVPARRIPAHEDDRPRLLLE